MPQREKRNTVSTTTMQTTASHRPLSGGHGVVEVFPIGADIVSVTTAHDILAWRMRRRRDGNSESLPSVHEGFRTLRELVRVTTFQYSKAGQCRQARRGLLNIRDAAPNLVKRLDLQIHA